MNFLPDDVVLRLKGVAARALATPPREPALAEDPTAGLAPGVVVAGRFEIEERVGAGGMGTVYRAIDQHSQGTVALKLLRAGPPDAERFSREATALAALSHPAIVRYVAHGRTSWGGHYVAMEWLVGETLADRLGAGPLGIGEAVRLAGRVADALGAAHRHGLVHGDVKPSNLFLCDGSVGRVKVLDLGLARRTHDLRGPTQQGTLVGTPGYMAPEQVRGDASTDPRTDVFALGCVLFECLSGVPAFAGADLVATLAKILFEEPVALRESRPEAPLALQDLLARMLAKDPRARPADGHEVSELFAGIGEVPSDAGACAPAARSEKLTGSERRLLGAIAVPGPIESTPDLHSAAERYGGRPQTLSDGSLVVTLSSAASATDLAAQTARCALAIRALLPSTPIALAIGRGVVSTGGVEGDAVDRSLRLGREACARAAVAPPGRGLVLLDPLTADLLDGPFDVERGAEGPVLRGEREQVEPARTLLGRPSPFVGRRRELGVLLGILEESAAEPMAHAVLVTAPPGLGKSRLRHEFVRRLRHGAGLAEVWMGRGDAMSAGSPFGLIASALRRAAGMRGGEPLAARQAKLRAWLGRRLRGEALARLTEFVGELVGVPTLEDPSVQLEVARRDPILMGDQIRRAWIELLLAECGARPLVLVLEDLHWGDLPSVRFVDAALRELRDLPLLVLAFGRPEVHDLFPQLWADREFEVIRLGALARRAGKKLVRGVLGQTVSDGVVERLVDRAQGNAFFLEELIRAVAKGHIDELPASVVAMAQSRIEGLEAEARRILRAASVTGSVFWRGGLEALLGGSAEVPQLGEWLEELAERELITHRPQSRFPTDEEYAFRHDLVRDAAYAMLTDVDRRLGHRLAGEWLERMGEVEAVALAEHYERGAEPRRALVWYRKAAEQALEGNDFGSALERAERGVGCGPDGVALGQLRFLQAQAHAWRGEFAGVSDRAFEALARLPAGDPSWYGAAWLASVASGRLGADETLALVGEKIVAREPSDEAIGPYVIAATRAALYLLFAGRPRDADRLLEHVGPYEPRVERRDPVAAARIHDTRGFRALFAGDPWTFFEQASSAVQRFEEGGDLRLGCGERVSVGHAQMEMGRFDQAEGWLRETLGAAERMSLPNIVAACKHKLGLCLARLGRFDEGAALEAETVQTFALQGDRRQEISARNYLAWIRALGGDSEAAAREARAALEHTQTHRPYRVQALAVLARALLEQGQMTSGLDAAREAMELLEALGTEEGESLARLTWAEALSAAGREEQGTIALESARRRLLDRAAAIGDPSYRRSFLEQVPEHARTMANGPPEPTPRAR